MFKHCEKTSLRCFALPGVLTDEEKNSKVTIGLWVLRAFLPVFQFPRMPASSRRAKRPPRNPRTPVKEGAGDEAGEESARCVTPRQNFPIESVTSPSPSQMYRSPSTPGCSAGTSAPAAVPYAWKAALTV